MASDSQSNTLPFLLTTLLVILGLANQRKLYWRFTALRF